MKRKMYPSSARCPAMHGDTRCCMMSGHAGWHHDGAWTEWLGDEERAAAFKDDPCRSSVAYMGRTVACELPAKHRTAHRGDDLAWTDPNR